MASAVSDHDKVNPETGARYLTFLDLPAECQRAIIGHVRSASSSGILGSVDGQTNMGWQCSQFDLICVSLVSKHFRELAAAQLYRNFHIVFPDEDDPAFDSPIDGLAGGLDTFVTSEYDYGKHLKDLSLDTLSAGDKAENAYKPYLYSASCGKFMNTLLLLTLRKAASLETFRWNIRVELSRPVYKALHQIASLNKLHVRMQAGPSLYETPPPLPYTAASGGHPPIEIWPDLPSMPPAPPGVFTVSPLSGLNPPFGAPGPPPLLLGTKPVHKAKAVKKVSVSNEPPTLSGFKKLRSLAVLDIDSLDMITELKICVRNSSSTLTKLKLSLSDKLAMQSRKPPPDADPEDSDVDDEFQVVPISQSSSATYMDEASGPARAFRAQEEKKSQESVLGRIFGVEPFLIKQPAQRRSPKGKEKEKETKGESSKNPEEVFVNAIKVVANKLMTKVEHDTQRQQEILDLMETAAKKYVDSDHFKQKIADGEKTSTKAAEGLKSEDGSSSLAGSSTDAAPGSNALTAEASSSEGESKLVKPSAEVIEPSAPESDETTGPGLFDTKTTTTPKFGDPTKEADPEDIDIEQPVEVDDSEDSAASESKDLPSEGGVKSGDTTNANANTDNATIDVAKNDGIASPLSIESNDSTLLSDTENLSPDMRKCVENLKAQTANYQTMFAALSENKARSDSLRQELTEAKNGSTLDVTRTKEMIQLKKIELDAQVIQKQLQAMKAEIDDTGKQLTRGADEAKNHRMSDYIRSTRGIALESLSIHLIPIKPSVLSRAVDLRALKRLTLLNVGNQAPLWNVLSKENKVEPLALRKIFTDNVSPAFLMCVSQLQELVELFMLERSQKHKPESFAPKTTVTGDQIRRIVLKKHIHTLKKLMIKNEAGVGWDIDEKAMLLICLRGANLEELAISMGIRAVVSSCCRALA
jgi:hypothetical protein